MPVKVAIIEDDNLMRKGLVSLFSSSEAQNENIDLVGDVGCEEDFIKLLKTVEVDVLLLDMNLNDVEDAGVEILSRLNKNIKVLILSSEAKDANLILKSLKCGASGFLDKGIELEELFFSIKKAKNGMKPILSDRVSGTVVEYKSLEIKVGVESLEPREKETFKLFAAGYTRQEVANKLYVSVKAIDGYKSQIKGKTGFTNPVEYLMWVIKNKEILISEIMELYSEKEKN